MREFAVYDPQDFGMSGTPADDEACVVLRDINNGKTYLTYIYTEDLDSPPTIDLDSIEEIISDIEEKRPVINHICMRKDGTVVMDSAEEIVLSERQNKLLAYPSTLFTLEGRMVTQENSGSITLFNKDLTLEGIPATKLDYKRVSETIKEKYPDLLAPTHETYGNRFPYFPHAKYFEDKDKMVVFVTKQQVMQMDQRLLNGEIPFYNNYYLAEKWDINTTYAVCIIDEKDYKMRFISPKALESWRDKELEAETGER